MAYSGPIEDRLARYPPGQVRRTVIGLPSLGPDMVPFDLHELAEDMPVGRQRIALELGLRCFVGAGRIGWVTDIGGAVSWLRRRACDL